MSKQKIQLSDHFDYSRLLRFVLPCIGTMLFTSIYGIVDGLCVSNFVGKTAFAAVNLIMPLPMLIGSIGFMLGTGGSAIVGITLGEGDGKKADELFSLFLSSALAAGIVFSAVGLVIIEPVAELLGAKGEMLDYALRYGRILLVSSMWGQTGGSCEVAYSAAKAGLIGLGKALAKEEGPSGITVNVIAPGVINTDMMAGFTDEDRAALAED